MYNRVRVSGANEVSNGGDNEAGAPPPEALAFQPFLILQESKFRLLIFD